MKTKKLYSSFAKSKGFNLIELVSVLAIIGILAVAIVGLGQYMKKKAYATHAIQVLTSICSNATNGLDDHGANFAPNITEFQAGGTYSVGLNASNADQDGNTYELGTYSSGSPSTLSVTLVASAALGQDGLTIIYDKIRDHTSIAPGSGTIWNSVVDPSVNDNGTIQVICNLS